jgi:CDP-diacylglycerol--serine O-phosphatidyltransferase
MVCAVLRLARFNTENTPDPASHKRFKGLPSPAAAGCVAALALLRSELSFYESVTGLDAAWLNHCLLLAAPIGTLLVALLMVSRISYPHLLNQMVRRRRNFGVVVQVVLAISFLVIVQDLAPFLLFWAYALYGPVRHALRRVLPPEPVSPEAAATPLESSPR